MPIHLPRLLVMCTAHMGESRRIMKGLMAYSNEREPIEFLFKLDAEDISAGLAQKYSDVEGYVLGTYKREWIEALIATGRPVVMTYPYPDPRVAQVICDNPAIGRLAFAHFHSLGLKQFAALQMPWAGAEFAHQRVAGFAQAANKAGFRVHFSPVDPPIQFILQDRPRLVAWLKSLPKPIGLFCMTVIQAAEVIPVVRQAELRIPDDLAVLSVDRDDLVCNLVTPKLSTIDTGAYHIGYESARLALRMLRGAARPKKPIIIPPGEVIVRQSTDMLAIEDADLVAAVRFIRRHACQGIQIKDVLAQVPMSRRTLELKFKHIFGRTVRDEIAGLRVSEAKRLLSGTNLNILEVSLRSGFSFLSDFGRVFRRLIGLTPREYRRRYRGSSSR